MTLDEQSAFSFYKEIAVFNESHRVTLVQHIETKKIFVKKAMAAYSRTVFEYLKAHPIEGTPKIFELAEDDGLLFVIEEYLPGNNLQEILDSNGNFSERETQQIILSLCDIVSRLHDCTPPIIHRDIKPSNIILTPNGDVKLIDMNAAKEYDNFQSQDTQFIGTAGYAAPEQYGFGASSPRTDVYAIGVLINNMLTGKSPQAEHCSGKFENIVSLCTSIDPAKRYSSVLEVSKAISKIRFNDSSRECFNTGYALPGFRTGKTWKKVTAVIIYAIIIFLGICVKGNGHVLDAILNKIFCTLSFALPALLCGNYLNCWNIIGISKIKNKFLKLIALAVSSFILFLLAVMMLVILEKIIYG